jgi:hypothetical protein
MSQTNETMMRELIIYQEPTDSYVIYIVIILIIIYLVILFIWLMVVKLKEVMDTSISRLENDSTQKINTLTQAYYSLKEEMNCMISGIADDLKEETTSRNELKEEVNISQVADELKERLSQMIEEKINKRTQCSGKLKEDMRRVFDELEFINQCYDNVKILISQDYKDLDEKINIRTQCTDNLKEELTQVVDELEEKINVRTQCSDNLKGKISQVSYDLEEKINMRTEAVALSISQVVEDLNILKKKFSYKKICKRRRNNFHRRNQIFKKVILPLQKENIFLQDEINALKKEVEAISYASLPASHYYSSTYLVDSPNYDSSSSPWQTSEEYSINSNKLTLRLEVANLIKINYWRQLKTIWFRYLGGDLTLSLSNQNTIVNKIIIQHPVGNLFEIIPNFVNLEELIIVLEKKCTYNFIPLFCENKIKKVTIIKFKDVSTPDLSPVVSFYTSKKAEVEIIQLTEEPYKYICEHYYN